MDLLTTRPKHRRPPQNPTPRRRPSNASSVPISTQNQRRSASTERKPVQPKKTVVITERKSEHRPISSQKNHQPIERNFTAIPKKISVETKDQNIQTEAILIEKKLHDDLLKLLEDSLDVIKKNLQKILDEKSKSIEESYGKLIEDVLHKIDGKNHGNFQEKKKNLESKLKDYKNHIKNKNKMEKQKEREGKGKEKEIQKSAKNQVNSKPDHLKLKRQFSLEKLTKLSLGVKQSIQEVVETRPMKRQYSFENPPNKNHHTDFTPDSPTPTNHSNPKEGVDDLKSRLTKVMSHFKSTEVLNGHHQEEDQEKSKQNPETLEPPTPTVASFPLENDTENPMPSTSSFYDEITVLEDDDENSILEEQEIILPPEDFQEHPYDEKRDQELDYLKSLKEKLTSLRNQKTSESSSELNRQDEVITSETKKSPNDTKRIKEIKTKLTQLLTYIKSSKKVEFEKAEKKLLKLKVKYINVKFLNDEEFQTIRSEVIELFTEAEKIIESGKHGLRYTEDMEIPRRSVTSESAMTTDSENSCNMEAPHVKLERLKIMLEQMVSDIEGTEILSYDAILIELNKLQEEFFQIKNQLLPEAVPLKQEVLNLLIQAYNVLEDKS